MFLYSYLSIPTLLLFFTAFLLVAFLLVRMRQSSKSGPKLTAVVPGISEKTSGRRNLFLGVIITVALLGGLAGGVVLVRQQQEIRSRASIICGECNTNSDCDSGYRCNANQCCVSAGPAPAPTPPPPSPPPPALKGCYACQNYRCVQVRSGGCDPGAACDPNNSAATCGTPPPTPPPSPPPPPAPTCSGNGAACQNDDTCCSKVCSYATCRGTNSTTGCGGFDEPTCWTHQNCHWDANLGSCQGGALPPGSSTGCQISCSAGEGGVSVIAKSGNCAGATVSVTWFASRCGGTSGLCGGTSRGGSGGLPFHGGMSGSGCSWQADVTANVAGGGSCGNSASGVSSNCTTTPPSTPPPTPPPSPPPPTSLENASCQMVTADKPLSSLTIGQPVTFTGYGWVSSGTDKIDEIEFLITKDGATALDNIVPAVRAPEKDTGSELFYKTSQIYTPDGPGNYSVQIRVHWQNKNIWMD